MDITQLVSMDLNAMTREQLIEAIVEAFDLLAPEAQKEVLQIAEAGRR